MFSVDDPSNAVVTSTTTSLGLDVALTLPKVTLPPLYVTFEIVRC